MQFSLFGWCPANLTVVFQIYITSLGLTCCEIEKPIIISPSGTSQDIVAESARRCMTDTLTGAGGRSEGKETKTEGSVNPPIYLDIQLFTPTTGVCFELKSYSQTHVVRNQEIQQYYGI